MHAPQEKESKRSGLCRAHRKGDMARDRGRTCLDRLGESVGMQYCMHRHTQPASVLACTTEKGQLGGAFLCWAGTKREEEGGFSCGIISLIVAWLHACTHTHICLVGSTSLDEHLFWGAVLRIKDRFVGHVIGAKAQIRTCPQVNQLEAPLLLRKDQVLGLYIPACRCTCLIHVSV